MLDAATGPVFAVCLYASADVLSSPYLQLTPRWHASAAGAFVCPGCLSVKVTDLDDVVAHGAEQESGLMLVVAHGA